MTESEWLNATDPQPMLDFLRGGTSARKVRLFACAACREVWPLLKDERSRRAVEVSEAFADERAEKDDLERAASRAFDAYREYSRPSIRDYATEAITAYAAHYAATPMPAYPLGYLTDVIGAEGGRQIAASIRDIFGNPFRPVTADPKWLTSAVVDLARTMYDSQDFSPMPILADALEETGCDNAHVLDHCRGGGPHVRGCWVVDLVLGKG